MMLVAVLNNIRVEINEARRGEKYFCPRCGHPVIAHLGKKVVHHFKHQPGATCSHGQGETWEHLEAKHLLIKSLRNRGLGADIEVYVQTNGDDGNRQADILVTGPPPRNCKVAIELQRTKIEPNDIKSRTCSYTLSGVYVLWIPFLLKERIGENDWMYKGEMRKTGVVERYSARPWEKWLFEIFEESPLWYYEPVGKQFWKATSRPCELWVEETSFYDEYGDCHTHGGYYRFSERWVELHLEGPYQPDELLIKISPIKKYRFATFVKKDVFK